MKIQLPRCFRVIHLAGIAVSVGLLGFWASPAKAAPFTDHFAGLIADLQTRAGALSNSTDKTEQKQFKAIQKVFKALEGKDSLSLATDIKNAGKIAKTLVKTFPTDFIPPGSALSSNLEDAIQGLAGDVQAVGDGAQTVLDGLGPSSCKDKAQTSLTTAQGLLDAADATIDIPTAAKLIGSALKAALKASATAAGCMSGGGGGNGDFLKATITGDFSLNFQTLSAVPPTATTISALDLLMITGGDSAFGGVGLSVGVSLSSVAGPGTYPVVPGSNVIRSDTSVDYSLASGTITFTTFDLAGQNLVGTFSFTATQIVPTGSGTVTVTNGSFSISTIMQQ
jgi:hypothetical protein